MDEKSPKKAMRVRSGGRRLRQRTTSVLPSLLTLANLLCGFAAIFYATRMTALGQTEIFTRLDVAAYLIFLGMVFDSLDGRLARITKRTTELGAQLDSMSDMVTFGVAPAVLAVQLVRIGTSFDRPPQLDQYFDRIILISAAAYVVCCALRLARFNLELQQPGDDDHLSFKGLPSPAAAGALASLVLLHQRFAPGSVTQETPSTGAQATAIAIVVIALLLAAAMVSTLRYTHLVNRYLRGRAPFAYIATVVVSALLLLIDLRSSLSVAFIAYALSRPSAYLRDRVLRRGRRGSSPPPAREWGSLSAPEAQRTGGPDDGAPRR